MNTYTIKTDCHTHSLISGHAFSTVEENIRAAAELDLEAIAITEHAPAMPGGPDPIHFVAYRMLPRRVGRVTLLRGVEANVIDYDGSLDLGRERLRNLDLVIASLHEVVLVPRQVRAHTQVWIKLAEDPYVDCFGHPGRGAYPFELAPVLDACAEHNTAIEINNHTLDSARDVERCRQIALGCMARGVPVFVNSDAHFSGRIGSFEHSLKLLSEIDFPENLIVNRDRRTLLNWLQTRRPWLDFKEA